jgi:hypothetical protein
MGWFIKATNLDLWLGLSLIIMIETFYEIFLASIIGLTIFIKVPAISYLDEDWISIAINCLFWLFIMVFLMTTMWFTISVHKE